MERVQIDLVDMKSLVVTKGGKSYRYVLSIMDVFSRYVVLRALSDKTATAVADQLKDVFAIIENVRKYCSATKGRSLRGLFVFLWLVSMSE